MDDFDVSNAESTPPPPVSESSGGRGKRRTSTGSNASCASSTGTSVGERGAKFCQYPTCDSEAKSGRRHCAHHNRHLDNSRTQASKKFGAEGLRNFSGKCKDIAFANKQITYMAEQSVGLSMFARAPLIDWTLWQQEFGTLVETKDATQTRPFEEEQWIIKQVTKFGRNREQMVQEWKQKLAGPWRRDNKGYEGSLRLWLPALEYEEKASAQFVKGGALEASKAKKNPKAFEQEAFRPHALEANLTHGHSFFSGVGGADGDGLDDEVEPVSEAAGSSDCPAADPKAGPNKRKAIAVALDASEDEDERAAISKSAKKPRKAGNLSSARAALYDQVSKQFIAKAGVMEGRLKDAKKAMDDEAAAPRPVSQTDIMTRNLYVAALKATINVVSAWLEPQFLKDSVVKHNKAMTDAQTPDKVLPLDVEETVFLRSRDCMQNFVDSIPKAELDQAGLDKKRLVWRRMFSCLGQVEASLKKCSNDVAKHVQAVAAAREKELKKEKDKEAKLEAAKHLSSAQEKLKKAKADGADVPAIFKLQGEDVVSMKVEKADSISSGTDLSLPLILESCSHVQEWSGNAALLQVMTNFGARYKKTPNFDTLGKITQPLAPKAGKEATEKLFMSIMNPVNGKIVDLSAFAASWMAASWIFGCAPKRCFASFAPNCAACLRVLMYGEIEVFALPATGILQALKDAGLHSPTTMTELEEASRANNVAVLCEAVCLANLKHTTHSRVDTRIA